MRHLDCNKLHPSPVDRCGSSRGTTRTTRAWGCCCSALPAAWLTAPQLPLTSRHEPRFSCPAARVCIVLTSGSLHAEALALNPTCLHGLQKAAICTITCEEAEHRPLYFAHTYTYNCAHCAHAQGLCKLPVDEAGAVLGIAREVLDSWFATYMQVARSLSHPSGFGLHALVSCRAYL